jgi:hypothetical protein
MIYHKTIGLITMTAALAMAIVCGQAAEQGKYPEWQGAWARWAPPNSARDGGNGGVRVTAGGQPSFDQSKPWGFGQEAPLTPEYRKVLEDSMADQAKGGQGNFFDHAVRCMPGGMPLNMIAFNPIEFVVTPETTYILIGGAEHYRRIFTDGRDWPSEIEPTYAGYSIGRWLDEDGDGNYDVLEVETRGPFKGPRAYDATGLPLHFDNESVFKERIYRDKNDKNLLHDTMTVIDHALIRPWIVDKKYVRDPNPRPVWDEQYCTENPTMIAIGKEIYYLGGDGKLMPIRSDQPAPDLKFFNQKPK